MEVCDVQVFILCIVGVSSDEVQKMVGQPDVSPRSVLTRARAVIYESQSDQIDKSVLALHDVRLVPAKQT
jgi:hypothetical protein